MISSFSCYLFQSTQAVAVIIITREYAVFACHNTCHEVAVPVRVSHSLLVNNSLR